MDSRNSGLSCTICNVRKEKRFCPAVHGRICPQCCGEQREITLDCTSSCPYLQQAREHEKPRDLVDIDRAALFPAVEIGKQFVYEHEHLIVGLSFALSKSARADRALADPDLIAALTSLAGRYERQLNSSLIYEQPSTNLSLQTIIRELETMIGEYRATEQQHMGVTRLRDSEVLKALVFLLRMGLTRTSRRPKSRAFADFILAQFPEKQSVIASPEEAGSRLIVP